MEDDLERFRKKFEEERAAADERRARLELEKQREKAYEAAWGTVFGELNRLEAVPESPPNLDPFEQLVSHLKGREQIQWLVEIGENFRDQLDRGLDMPDRTRRPELWFVNVLLCVAKSPPHYERAKQLLAEMRQRGFSPFGIAGIAGNVKDYVRDHLAAMEQIRREKRAEMLEKSIAVITDLAKGKPAIRRNLTFAAWSQTEGLKPAKIRDRWNAAEPEDVVGDADAGIGVVKQGLRTAKKFLRDLAKEGFPLTAHEAVEQLAKG